MGQFVIIRFSHRVYDGRIFSFFFIILIRLVKNTICLFSVRLHSCYNFDFFRLAYNWIIGGKYVGSLTTVMQDHTFWSVIKLLPGALLLCRLLQTIANCRFVRTTERFGLVGSFSFLNPNSFLSFYH